MASICVLNNYSFERVWSEVRAGEKPDHHLFGLNYFAEAGYKVVLASSRASSRWKILQKFFERSRFPIPLGNVAQQVETLRQRKSIDLIYAPCQTQTQLLGYLRRAGLQRVPMICLAHHPFEQGRLARIRRPLLRANLLGTDLYPSLSCKVATEINNLAGAFRSEVIPWGPQRDYYEIAEGPGLGVVAAGRTGRDFATFGRAATHAGSEGKIVCLASSVTPEFSKFGQNVLVRASPDNRPVGYRELTRTFASARVLAIPMFDGDNLSGLTSLTDALGVGRPVIMTRNPCIDLDVETLGIGRWVQPGDVQGWTEALRWFESHPDEAMSMGRRARALVDGGLHSEAFARRMMQLFVEVLA